MNIVIIMWGKHFIIVSKVSNLIIGFLSLILNSVVVILEDVTKSMIINVAKDGDEDGDEDDDEDADEDGNDDDDVENTWEVFQQ